MSARGDITARKAAVTVADRATGADDCRLLLDALGLLPEQPKQPKPEVHGTPYRYRIGCRCGTCRDANTRRCAEARARVAADPSRADRAGHGNPSTYKNYGCRCGACRRANTERVSEFRAARRARQRQGAAA